MQYEVALSDADNEGQLGTNITVIQPFFFGGGDIEGKNHSWSVGFYNEILVPKGGQAGNLDPTPLSKPINLKLYVKANGKTYFGAVLVAFWGATGLGNSSGSGLVHKFWHQKGLRDGAASDWRTIHWSIRD